MENVYSIGIGENNDIENYGINIARGNGTVLNSYYFVNDIYQNKFDITTTKLALYDKNFQNRILNSSQGFIIDELIEQGYFPHVHMPDVMPLQDYIKLPEVKDADLPDILSIEVLEQGTSTAKVKIRINNPSGDRIKDIQIKNLTCYLELDSQKNKDGETEIIAELTNPIVCVSKYSVLSITTTNQYNIPYKREFKENERVINVDLYHEINTVEDWKQMNTSPTENYILMKDLDFINEGNTIRISNTLTGILDGNENKIKNINISTSIIQRLDGKIKNLYVENYNVENNSTNLDYIGFISLCYGESNNIHIKDMSVKRKIGSSRIGGIVGSAVSGANIRNCSVTNLYVETSNQSLSNIGGLVGNSDNSVITNSFVQAINIITNENFDNSIGGILGRETNINSRIENCYAIGNIKSDGSNIGGIVGTTKGKVERCYSKVNIETEGEYIGGIVGNNGNSNNDNIIFNLALGNLYTKIKNQNLNRIIGNSSYTKENYALDNQLINGYILEEEMGAVLISAETLERPATYIDLLKFNDNYTYEEVKKHILPKLNYLGNNNLLPNQQDNLIEEKKVIYIEDVEFQKTDVNTVFVQIVVNNEKKFNISNIKIDDMNIEIENITNLGEKTYINLTSTPIRYYDSYKISQIEYMDDREKKEIDVEARIEVEFYKELYSFEDWQSIEIGTYQNYRLMNDIDFSNRDDIKTNITMGKFVSTGHTLKNINISSNMTNSLIYQINNLIEGIYFENVSIENSSGKSNIGIIANSSATIKNLMVKDTFISADKSNYVGVIGKNIGTQIQNVVLDQIEVKGKQYIGGFIGDTTSLAIDQIQGTEIHVVASANYVGGIFGSASNSNIEKVKNIMISNSSIQGFNYVGGIAGISPGTDLKVEDTIVSGNAYVGGILGQENDARSSVTKNYRAERVQVTGNASNIGGLFGDASNISVCSIKDSFVIGNNSNTSRVGGIMGNARQHTTDMEVINTTIRSEGNNVGGISGYLSGHIGVSYVKNSKVEGYANIGGIVGFLEKDWIESTYVEANIKAFSSSVGGIVGFLDNEGMTAVNKISQIYRNYVANSNITSQTKAGGLIGDIATNLYTEKDYYNNNYIQADIHTENQLTVSLGIGGRKDQNGLLKQTYYYQYSKINGENPNMENEPFILNDQYLIYEDLKEQDTYQKKLKWSTYFDYTILQQGKYPILNNSKELGEQEGIALPIDSEHIVNGEDTEVNMLLEEDIEQEKKNETIQESFAYEGKTIQTYETYTKITLEDETTITRPERIYVKEGKVYILDGNLEMVVNNFVVDSYNGKEYETILGTDGRLYDLKESLHYPENFQNKDIKEIGNNLEKEAKEITVTYKDGSYVRFNYQTGEILEEEKVEQEVSLFSYIAEAFQKENVMLEPSKESYEESKELIGKLEKFPIEQAIERKEISNGNITNQITQNETIENRVQQETNNQINQGITSKEKTYISKYNSKTGEYEVYDKEEILESKESEVISEEEKIEKENLKEYYSEGKRAEEKQGIVWIMLSIAGAVIILIILGRKMTVKKKKDPSTRKRR